MQDGCAKAVTTEMAARVMCIVEWFVVWCGADGVEKIVSMVGCMVVYVDLATA